MFYKLKENQGSLIDVKKSPISLSFQNSLEKDGYKRSYTSSVFSIFAKYTIDKKEPLLKRPMLIVYVIIHDTFMDYQDKLIVKQINAIEDGFYKEKKRITNYTIFIIKSGKKISPEIQSSCDYVTFSKIRNRSVVNINAFYQESNKTFYFLYSDTYTPNAFYAYAVNLLKTLISK